MSRLSAEQEAGNLGPMKQSRPRVNVSRASRNTRQREAIMRAFAVAGRPLSPLEAHRWAAEQLPNIALTSVYRAIKRGLEEGNLIAVAVPGDHPRYEPAGKAHHHFFCRKCEGLYDVFHCPDRIGKSAPPGFLVEDHHITLFGVCKICRP